MVFFLTKLLAFLPFGNLFRGTSLKIILIVGAIALVAFLYWRWKDNIRTAVYEEVFQQQVESQLDEQQKEFDRLKRAVEARNRAIEELLASREKLVRRYEKVLAEIQSGSYDSGDVSDVLRMTIEQIRRTEQNIEVYAGQPIAVPAPPVPKPDTGNASIEEWRDAQ